MSDDKKRTKDAILNELESIKDLLGEEFDDDDVPLLTSHIDDIDDAPPMLTEALNDVIDDVRASFADDDIPTLETEEDEERYGDDDFDVEELADLPEIENLKTAKPQHPPLATIDAEQDDEDDIVSRALRSNSFQSSKVDEVLIEDDADIDLSDLEASNSPPAKTSNRNEPHPSPAPTPDEDLNNVDDEFGIMIDDDHFEIVDDEDTVEGAQETNAQAALEASKEVGGTLAVANTTKEQTAAAKKEANLREHQPSLFDPPKTTGTRGPLTKNAEAALGPAAPSSTKTENPFLPKHIRDRLHTNRTLQQEIDATHTHNTATQAAASQVNTSDDKLVDQVLKTVLPKIETELRQKIRELIQEERNKKS